ncbi:unnamed protein product [Prunus brigantina]
MMRSVGLVPKLGDEGSHSSVLIHVSGAYWPFILGLNFVEVGRSRWRRQRVASSRWVERRFDFRASRAMSDSESGYERDPNAYEGESSDGLFDTDSGGVAPDAEDGSDTDVKIIGECSSSAPSYGIRKGFMTAPVPLTIVYADGRQVVPGVNGETNVGQQPEASTSGRGESAAEPSSRPRVSVVFPSNPRVLMGVPKDHLFGVDYLEPNRITEVDIAKFRKEYFIPDSVRMRIPTPTKSLSKPKDGEVVFFTDVLLQGVRLPLQPAVQKILAEIGYAPGQFNPNFWVALMGVVTAFGMAGMGEPSYEQFSHLYRKLKQPVATQAEIRQIDQVRAKVPAVERVYPKLLFTANLIKAQLANPAEMTEERRATEAKRMSESSKRHLMMGLEGKKKKGRQPETVRRLRRGLMSTNKPFRNGFVDSTPILLRPGRQQLVRLLAEGCLPKAPFPQQPANVHLPSIWRPSRLRSVCGLPTAPEPSSLPTAPEPSSPADPVTLACPSKTVQFANHMILGSQMELSEIEDLPKKLLREEAGRAFRLQASASMDMWLCVK